MKGGLSEKRDCLCITDAEPIELDIISFIEDQRNQHFVDRGKGG